MQLNEIQGSTVFLSYDIDDNEWKVSYNGKLVPSPLQGVLSQYTAQFIDDDGEFNQYTLTDEQIQHVTSIAREYYPDSDIKIGYID